ncbi:NusA N-terminal domain-containing protein [Mycoplasma sp. 005V]|uniref:NusA N-terminal domain-containing protein n=1 Tax=unclassified Mycoplasma TaxID=2683645 RepID=UPI003A896CC0
MATKKTTPEVNNSEEFQLFRLINEVATHNDFLFEDIMEIFRQATERAFVKNIDKGAEILLEADYENKLVKMYNTNGEVVENDFEFNEETPEEKLICMTLAQAQTLNPSAEIGDAIKIPFTFADLPNRINVAILNDYKQEFKAIEKAKIIAKYSQLLGKKVDAKVLTRNKNGSYNVSFEDQITAFLPANKVNEKLNLQPGKFIPVYIDAINEDSKLSIVQVSTTSNTELFDLLFNEIPEIQNDDLQIVAIERSAGSRSKVALRKNPDRKLDFDTIGTVLGEYSNRINAISDLLGGEKIDLINYSDNILEYIKNALAPAKVLDVIIVKEEGVDKYYAIARDNEINIAIGKKGINIELASKLTNSRITVIKASEAIERGFEFKKADEFEPHYFKTTERNKSSKASKMLNNLDSFIDTDALFNNFNHGLDEFGNEVASENNSTAKAVKKVAAKRHAINMQDLDTLFDEEAIKVEDAIDSIDSYDFINEIEKYDIEYADENSDELEEEYAPESEEETSAKTQKVLNEFKNSKVQLKDFKVDDDLASYGLANSLDVSELADDDWE